MARIKSLFTLSIDKTMQAYYIIHVINNITFFSCKYFWSMVSWIPGCRIFKYGGPTAVPVSCSMYTPQAYAHMILHTSVHACTHTLKCVDTQIHISTYNPACAGVYTHILTHAGLRQECSIPYGSPPERVGHGRMSCPISTCNSSTFWLHVDGVLPVL